MESAIKLDPVNQSCSGFAQARTIVIDDDATRAARTPDAASAGSLFSLPAVHPMVAAFEAASHAARAVILEETNALVSETLSFAASALHTRTLPDLIDLHGNFARRRYLAAANLASIMLMPSNGPAHQAQRNI